jgi:hypothetical protein
MAINLYLMLWFLDKHSRGHGQVVWHGMRVWVCHSFTARLLYGSALHMQLVLCALISMQQQQQQLC